MRIQKTTLPEIIDNSMMATAAACPLKFALSYLYQHPDKKANDLPGLSSVRPSIHLTAGAAFAKGVEVARRAFYFNGKTSPEAIELGTTAILTEMADATIDEGTVKTPDRMVGALEFYFANYPMESDFIQPLENGLEMSFVVPITEKHLYAGRFDLLGQTKEGAIYIVDEKTASALGSSWANQWELDSQFTGYIWGLRENGVSVAAAMIRGISILKTKYGTEAAILYRSNELIQRWLDNIRLRLQLLEIQANEGNWQMALDKSICGMYGGCAYRQLCGANDPSEWVAVNFAPRQWSPVKELGEA